MTASTQACHEHPERAEGRGRGRRDRIDQATANLITAANELAALLASAKRHSDLDLAVRSNPHTRCPSCGGQTGTYDGTGQWYPCTPCAGLGYREGVVR